MHRTTPRSSSPPEQLELLGLSHDAVIGHRVHDGGVCFWNRGAEDIFGWTRAEALDQAAEALVPCDPPAAASQIRAALGSDGVWDGALTRRHRDGSAVKVCSRWTVLRDSRGQPAAYVEIDSPQLPARRHIQAEAALRASEQRVRRLIDSNIIGITVGDLEGRILDANDALLDIVGYTREDLLAGLLRWDRMTPPEYWAAEERAIAEAHRVGAATPWEKEYIRKDGRRIPVLIGFALLDESPGTTVAFVLDLTERKRAEAERERLLAEIRGQQALLERVFAASPAGLAVVGGRTPTVRFVNPAYLALAPEPAGDPVGRPIEEVWPERDDDVVLALVREVLVSGAHAERLGYRRTADGQPRSFSLQVAGFTWEDEPAALIALWETTALDAARAAAEAAVRERDEFISVAAHELKTPITALLALAQLTRRRVARGVQLDPAQVSDFAEHLHWQAERLSGLATRLLDITRIKAGQLALQTEPTDLVVLVRAVATATGLQRTIEVRTPDSLMADVDPVRVEQVVRNLVDNAIKYSPPGQPVEVELTQPSPETARLAVRDRGVGVPPEHRAHIFERFYRAHRDDQTSGMGLGLHISRQIVEQHGGHIAAEFPDDGGSRFIVTLPLGRKS